MLGRETGGHGLHSVESEYKLTKINSAINLYENPDPKVSPEVQRRRSGANVIDRGSSQVLGRVGYGVRVEQPYTLVQITKGPRQLLTV